MAQTARTRTPSTLTLPSDLEIRIERTFDAPREKVWRAFNDPELLPKWMGPAKYKMTTSESDNRAGGDYRWVWDLGDGNELVITGRILDIDEPARAVTAEYMHPFPDPSFNLLVFNEKAGKTTVSIHIAFPNAEARDGALASGMQDGMDEGYARLDALLAEME